MKKMKLEVSESVKLRIEHLKKILAGTPAGVFKLNAESGCGEQCKITCAHYCRSECEANCTSNCQSSRMTAGVIGCGAWVIWHI